MVAQLREMLVRALPEACSDPARREGLDLVLSYEAWSRLRREQGLPREEALTVVVAAAERLRAPNGG